MARGRKSPVILELAPDERETLQRWQRSTTMAAGLVRRGRIILLLADRHSPSHVAQVVGVQRAVVRQWARRCLAQRLAGRGAAPGRGATGGFSPGGGDPRGTPGLRTPRYPGPQSLPLGWPRTGAAAHRGGHRRGPLRLDRAADSGCPSTEALAPSSVAPSQTASEGSVLGHHRRVARDLHAATARG
jgi:hypothetical protein